MYYLFVPYFAYSALFAELFSFIIKKLNDKKYSIIETIFYFFGLIIIPFVFFVLYIFFPYVYLVSDSWSKKLLECIQYFHPYLEYMQKHDAYKNAFCKSMSFIIAMVLPFGTGAAVKFGKIVLNKLCKCLIKGRKEITLLLDDNTLEILRLAGMLLIIIHVIKLDEKKKIGAGTIFYCTIFCCFIVSWFYNNIYNKEKRKEFSELLKEFQVRVLFIFLAMYLLTVLFWPSSFDPIAQIGALAGLIWGLANGLDREISEWSKKYIYPHGRDFYHKYKSLLRKDDKTREHVAYRF